MYLRVDCGGSPQVINVGRVAAENDNFRAAVWTGSYMQMTVMCIPPGGEIGVEMHDDTDQFLRVEQGCGVVRMGNDRGVRDIRESIGPGDAVFVPAGTWHNIINAGRYPLKLSSIYAPPKHPKGTVHRTKEEANEAEY